MSDKSETMKMNCILNNPHMLYLEGAVIRLRPVQRTCNEIETCSLCCFIHKLWVIFKQTGSATDPELLYLYAAVYCVNRYESYTV